MSIINKILTVLSSTKVGEDQYGNSYYISRFSKGYLNNKRRYVVYNGIPEATKLVPMWHAWLHYLIDEPPVTEKQHKWQQDPLPNLTGTKQAYSPTSNGERPEVSADYTPWFPRGEK